MSNVGRIQEAARFNILRLLHENPEFTQRELGRRAGVSLGAVNYCLQALVEKGLIKVTNFTRSSNKLGYVYALTPEGLAEKSRMTKSFLRLKLEEYDALKIEIEQLSREAESIARIDRR